MKPEEYAKDLIKKEKQNNNQIIPFSDKIDIEGPYIGMGNDNQWGLEYEKILNMIMCSEYAEIKKHYDRAVQTEYSGGVTGHSYVSVKTFWGNLKKAFSDSVFSIEHRIGRVDEYLSPRAAIRWSLKGRHNGKGIFGEPTNNEVYIMGISHVEFGPRGIRREYCLYDEVAIWKQILAD